MVARLARLVAPEMPHHVVQRGNRRQQVFFDNEDKINYLKILEEKVKKYAVKVWAYCLMDNHVHVILVPQKQTDLAKAIGETHKEYTRMINFRYGCVDIYGKGGLRVLFWMKSIYMQLSAMLNEILLELGL